MKIHIVKEGDTLYKLSQKYNVSLETMISANPQIANPNELTIGMKVKIPSAPVTTPPGNTIIHSHTVVQGDSLWKLSKAWGVPLQDLIAANPQLKNPNVLLVGEKVNIPAGVSANKDMGTGTQTNPTHMGTSPKTTVGSEQYTGVKEEIVPLDALPNYPQLPELPTMPEAPVAPKAELTKPKSTAPKAELTKPKPEQPKAEVTKPAPTPPKAEETKPKPVPPKAEITKPIAPAPKPEMTKPMPPKKEFKPVAPPPKPLPKPVKQPEMVKPMPLPAPVKKPDYGYCDPCYPSHGMMMPFYEDKHYGKGHAGHWPGFHQPYGQHPVAPMGHHGPHEGAVPYGDQSPIVQGAYDQTDGSYTTYEHGGYIVDYMLVHGDQYGDCGCGQPVALPYSYAQAESDWKAATAQNQQPEMHPQAYGHQPHYTNYYRPNEYGPQVPYVDYYNNPYNNVEAQAAVQNFVGGENDAIEQQAGINLDSLSDLPKIEDAKTSTKAKTTIGKTKAKKVMVSSSARKRTSSNRNQSSKGSGLKKARRNPWLKR
ncbi:LysM peptidoglycan-binding domain-containing protein [Paenibacillus shunpengii]|uniref:LysM peptidoglycan-binding domain-containing protein n=1 Tax=Paenibacillus shunpengii TaxID=2054424 RepID=A0ABW5SUZ8_9BACL